MAPNSFTQASPYFFDDFSVLFITVASAFFAPDLLQFHAANQLRMIALFHSAFSTYYFRC